MVALAHFHQVEAIWSQSGIPAQTRETKPIFHVGQAFNTQQSGAETMKAWPISMVFLKAFWYTPKIAGARHQVARTRFREWRKPGRSGSPSHLLEAGE